MRHARQIFATFFSGVNLPRYKKATDLPDSNRLGLFTKCLNVHRKGKVHDAFCLKVMNVKKYGGKKVHYRNHDKKCIKIFKDETIDKGAQ